MHTSTAAADLSVDASTAAARRAQRVAHACADRELDRRRTDGIDVALMWAPTSNRVWVTVTDERSGDTLSFDVNPATARAAFQHPYPHASNHA